MSTATLATTPRKCRPSRQRLPFPFPFEETTTVSSFYQDKQFSLWLKFCRLPEDICWKCLLPAIAHFNLHDDLQTLGLSQSGCDQCLALCPLHAAIYMLSFNHENHKRRCLPGFGPWFTADLFLSGHTESLQALLDSDPDGLRCPHCDCPKVLAIMRGEDECYPAA
jgi:hypothetical protein